MLGDRPRTEPTKDANLSKIERKKKPENFYSKTFPKHLPSLQPLFIQNRIKRFITPNNALISSGPTLSA